MAQISDIPQRVHDLFPKSANHRKMVAFAWHPDLSEYDAPQPNGSEGWKPVHKTATRSVLRSLQQEGYTFVNIEAGGTANNFKDAPLSQLLG